MGKRLDTEKFIKRSREIHGKKYDYSKVEYVNSHTKVCIMCPEHGEFWQTPIEHLNGVGCIKCAGTYRSNTEEFIEKARKIHGDKFDYSKVEYINNKTPVCIICPIHGEFWQRPDAHLHGNGCEKCSYEFSLRSPHKTKDSFIEDAIQIHGNKFDYSKVDYKNNKTPICIICHETDEFGNEHGEFWQRPDNHLHGQSCPKCKHKTSKLEKKIEKFLHENNLKFEKEKRFKWLGLQRIDFYLPEYNIAIECQGEQHFSGYDFKGKRKINEKNLLIQASMDAQKKCLCEENGITVLYFTNEWIKKKYHCNDCITSLEILKDKIYG